VGEFPRPRIILSKCIELEACRYNGVMIPSPVVKLMMPHVDFLPVCPEVEIGLGVPRHPIRVVRVGTDLRLVQPETGKDLTDAMRGFVGGFLDAVKDVDGFVLKFRSPSCGMKNVKVYSGPEKGAAASKGAGFFGGAVVRRFPGLAVEDEGRLTNFRIREHFLTKVFALAAFREVEAHGRMGDLVEFHTRNKLMLMGYSQRRLRLLGRLVANPERKPVKEVIGEYRAGLEAAMANAPRSTSCINVLMHAMGYFSKQLTHREKAFFLDSLQDFREERVPLSVPAGIMKSYVVRFEEPYLMNQTFFDPYPEEMVRITDSGKGREL
jgi:uncharacterized protein YbgA (DUF1722 family)/uncharacterized protein YbbK (DUF523 family)